MVSAPVNTVGYGTIMFRNFLKLHQSANAACRPTAGYAPQNEIDRYAALPIFFPSVRK